MEIIAKLRVRLDVRREGEDAGKVESEVKSALEHGGDGLAEVLNLQSWADFVTGVQFHQWTVRTVRVEDVEVC